MEFSGPNTSGFTIYGKTGCSYCEKVKALLLDYCEPFIYVNCDEYLINDKSAFLEFMHTLSGKEHKTFPMVFSSRQFIGGYTDTVQLMLHTHVAIDK